MSLVLGMLEVMNDTTAFEDLEIDSDSPELETSLEWTTLCKVGDEAQMVGRIVGFANEDPLSFGQDIVLQATPESCGIKAPGGGM